MSYDHIISSIHRKGTDQYLNPPDIQLWNSMLLLTACEYLQPKALLTLSQSNPFRRNDQNTSNPSLKARIQSQHFYRYWPYLPRMTHGVAHLMKRSKMAEALTQSPLFLTLNGFRNISEAFIPIIPVGEEMLRYLQTLFKLTFVPQQLASDLAELKGRYSPLTSAMVREKLKRAGMDRTLGTLQGGNALLIMSLLTYCTADAYMKTERQGQGQGHGQGLQFDVVSSRNAWRDLAGQSAPSLAPYLPLPHVLSFSSVSSCIHSLLCFYFSFTSSHPRMHLSLH